MAKQNSSQLSAPCWIFHCLPADLTVKYLRLQMKFHLFSQSLLLSSPLDVNYSSIILAWKCCGKKSGYWRINYLVEYVTHACKLIAVIDARSVEKVISTFSPRFIQLTFPFKTLYQAMSLEFQPGWIVYVKQSTATQALFLIFLPVWQILRDSI